jgi:hypothetical protein
MCGAQNPAYIIIIVGSERFRKHFPDNFFTKKRCAQIFSHQVKKARPGKARWHKKTAVLPEDLGGYNLQNGPQSLGGFEGRFSCLFV